MAEDMTHTNAKKDARPLPPISDDFKVIAIIERDEANANLALCQTTPDTATWFLLNVNMPSTTSAQDGGRGVYPIRPIEGTEAA